MSLENEILADLHELPREHGLSTRWTGIDMRVLSNRIDISLQFEIGGFADAPDLAVRVPKVAFKKKMPNLGKRLAL